MNDVNENWGRLVIALQMILFTFVNENNLIQIVLL